MSNDPNHRFRSRTAPGRAAAPADVVKAVGRKAGAALTVIATMLVGLIVLAAPAGAHHPEGRLTDAACRSADDVLTPYSNADQVLRVDYTAMPWFNESNAQASFAHDDVTIEVSVNGGDFTEVSEYYVDETSITPANGAVAGDESVYVVDGAFVPVQPNLVFPLLSDDGPNRLHTQSGYFLIESDNVVTSIEGRIIANGPWRNGSGGNESRSMQTLEPYGLDCEPEVPVVEPAASSVWECGTDISVTLDNSASDVAVDFVVNGGAAVTVAAGATQEVTLDAPVEDGAPVEVSVTVNGQPIHTDTYTADCVQAVVSSTWECGTDIVITLDNSASTLSASFEIGTTPVDPELGMAAVAVPAGAVETRTFDGPVEDGSAIAILVLSDGEEAHAATYGPSNCLDPVAISNWDCGLDITVTLDNSESHLPVDFVVNGGDPVTVEAGDTTQVTLAAPVEDGAAVPVSVTVDGEEILADSHGPANCVEDNQEICEDDENAVDSNADGENDSCEPICEDDVDPSDTDGDNVGDTCPEVLDSTTVFPTSQPASAAATNSLAFTGSGTLAMATGALVLLLIGFGLTLAGKELSEA